MRNGSRSAILGIALGCTGCLGSTAPTPVDDFGPREPLFLRDTIVIGFRPYGVAVAGSTALVTQLDAGEVQRFTLPARTPRRIAVGDVPTGIAIDASGTRAVVTNQHDDNVGIIDVATGTQTAVVPAGATTFRALFSPTGQRAYVTSSAGSLFALDMTTGTFVDTATTVAAANGLALAGDTLLVVTSMFGGIAYVDARTLVETRRIEGTGTYQDVVLRQGTNRFYVAVESRPVIEIRALDSGAIVDSIIMTQGTFGLTRRPKSNELWATQGNRLSVIDLPTGAVVRTLLIDDPRRIAFDADGNHGVVTSQSGSVYFLRP